MRQIDSGSSGVTVTFNALGQRAIGRTAPACRRVIRTTRRGSFWGDTARAGGTPRFPSPGACWRSMRTGAPRRCISTTPTPWARGSNGPPRRGLGRGVLFYPWGAQWGSTTNGYQLFASLLWYDPETDGYQTPNRYYIPRLGRWLTPDPQGGEVSAPQSLNRYAYVVDNPASLTDWLGLDQAFCSDPAYAATDPLCWDSSSGLNCGGRPPGTGYVGALTPTPPTSPIPSPVTTSMGGVIPFPNLFSFVSTLSATSENSTVWLPLPPWLPVPSGGGGGGGASGAGPSAVSSTGGSPNYPAYAVCVAGCVGQAAACLFLACGPLSEFPPLAVTCGAICTLKGIMCVNYCKKAGNIPRP